ncbi:MAG: ADP-ribosylglycohydrolase family protein [Oscillospiraceae bacterium]|nr:ADP-ribosylglycohydrolase family protein [Oscillospiraceae bacterium]
MDNWENKFRGCLIGGAAGDALGYAVEFMNETSIFSEYGEHGITEYKLTNGIARISDDTQMTMFTAAALIDGAVSGNYMDSIVRGYRGWYQTQAGGAAVRDSDNSRIGQLLGITELYSRRAPGVTCLSALGSGKVGTIEDPINDSKGCGGVMRVAPIGLIFANGSFSEVAQNEIDMLGAKAAAITHGHELGYIPAAALVHIINFLVRNDRYTFIDAVADSVLAMRKLFGDTKNVKLFHRLMEKAVTLAENGTDDLTAIHQLGEGWVAEETLAIAVYCAVKYQNNFGKAICAAVNHNGDSDSTGAVCGNILGAAFGYDRIPQKFKDNLELHDILIGLADDLMICAP